jgi:lysophospholipase L1-like esterase
LRVKKSKGIRLVDERGYTGAAVWGGFVRVRAALLGSVVVFGLGVAAGQTVAAPKPPDWAQLGRYQAANAALPAKEKGRVVFYGDSITDAWAQMPEVFFPGKPFVGRGISGQTTPQMLVRFRQDVIDLHPEAVVILAGTNDVAGNAGPMTAKMTEENLMSMADLARVHHIKVVLCSIMPVLDYPWKHGVNPSPKIQAINAWMKGYAAEQGFAYVDYYSAMDDGTGAAKAGLTKDGVHPTVEGYKLMEPLALAGIGGK